MSRARLYYAAIYAQAKGTLRNAMIDALCRAKSHRGQRRTTPAGGSMVSESLRIRHLPEEIEQRLMPGHREGGVIKGACNRSAVGAVAERKTRFVVLSTMTARTAGAALEGFSRQMAYIPPPSCARA